MAEAGHEWAAVALFYAAYHDVKAALLEDVIFDSFEACQAVSPDLLPQDRKTTRHQGRKQTASGREWGINELVLKLYRPAAGSYEKLHQMSNDVRYQAGLRGSVSDVLVVYERFCTMRDEDVLSAAGRQG